MTGDSFEESTGFARGSVELHGAVPRISVVCPTFNSSGFVVRALESVVAQTHLPFEIVVSDDGSVDDTVGCARTFLEKHPTIRSVVIQNAHRGPGAARNEGIRQAKSEWIAFLDSDDAWFARKLEVVAEAIRSFPDVNLVCHSEEHLCADGTMQLLDYGARVVPGRPLSLQLYFTNLFSPSAVTCSKNLLHQAGLFDEQLLSWQDYELWIRMSPWIKPFFIREVLGMYCQRPGSVSTGNRWRLWKNAVRIAIRHRDKVTSLDSLYRVLWLTASFGFHGIRRVCGAKG